VAPDRFWGANGINIIHPSSLGRSYAKNTDDYGPPKTETKRAVYRLTRTGRTASGGHSCTRPGHFRSFFRRVFRPIPFHHARPKPTYTHQRPPTAIDIGRRISWTARTQYPAIDAARRHRTQASRCVAAKHVTSTGRARSVRPTYGRSVRVTLTNEKSSEVAAIVSNTAMAHGGGFDQKWSYQGKRACTRPTAYDDPRPTHRLSLSLSFTVRATFNRIIETMESHDCPP